MTDEIQMMEALEARAIRREGRRAFFKAAIGAAAVGAGGLAVASAVQAANPAAPTEADILNFALNLEYLEANFYSLAVYGTPLVASLTASGSGTPGDTSLVARAPVDFTSDAMVGALAREIAEDEIAHVTYLRQQLKTAAVAQPKLDLGVVPSATSAFSVAAQKSGVVGAGATFDPFDSIGDFLLGAFLFEDVGATAYRGALPSITTAAYVDAASAILSVEAQHAGAIRTQLHVRGVSVNSYVATDPTLVTNANFISDGRDLLDGATADLDKHVTADDPATQGSNVAALDADGLGISRTVGQVLNIVYLNSAVATKGGFFPNGMNGLINSSTAAA